MAWGRHLDNEACESTVGLGPFDMNKVRYILVVLILGLAGCAGLQPAKRSSQPDDTENRVTTGDPYRNNVDFQLATESDLSNSRWK